MSKIIAWFLWIILFSVPGIAQQADWLSYYEECKERTISDRFFKHSDIMDMLEPLLYDDRFELKRVGRSLEKREIYLIKIGSGDNKILMWSQMHGDEPTATMAIMDLLNFFRNGKIALEWKEQFLSEWTVYIVPMLNPDGAERYDRRNAAFIDLNRDALRLQSPESRILKALVDSLQPDFGFNLHDQSKYYAAGYQTDSTASFSFLAPPYNTQRDINDIRLQAMQLIASLDQYIQGYLPGKVGRYSDSYEPRAFGDNITKWGTSTILIECGGLKGDPEKQYIRKVHFGLFLHAFDCLMNKCYSLYTKADYQSIPPNHRILEDLILRKVIWHKEGEELLVDLAFKREEVEIDNHQDVSYKGQLVDVGDLSTSRAYTDIDMDSFIIESCKIMPEIFEISDLPTSDTINRYVKSGYNIARLEAEEIPLTLQQGHVRWVHPEDKDSWKLDFLGNPSFYLREPGSGKLRYLLNNGQLFDLKKL